MIGRALAWLGGTSPAAEAAMDAAARYVDGSSMAAIRWRMTRDLRRITVEIASAAEPFLAGVAQAEREILRAFGDALGRGPRS